MGRANLRKKRKQNGLVGSKTGGGEGQPKEKEKTNGLVGSKTEGGVGQILGKRENKWISRV